MSENLIPITRPSITSPIPQSNTSSDVKFPTEVIGLPSKGWFYPENNPLSKGSVEIKMMTAKEEDILCSVNLIQKKIVLDKLLESIIVDKNINPDDILMCDRNAIFFATRRLAYGDEYNASLVCPRCGQDNKIVINLKNIDNKPFDETTFVKGSNSFEFILPYSKNKIVFKLLTKKDDFIIEKEIETFSKISKEISKEATTRLAHIIVSVDGETDKMKIRKFVDNIPARDVHSLRKHIREFMPDVDASFDFSCDSCTYAGKEDIPMGITFFWPNR